MRIVMILKVGIAVSGLVAFGLECFGSHISREDFPEMADGHVESPLLTANVFSIWSFSWMSGLMKKGAKKFITEEDLPSLVPSDESGNLGKALREAMKKRYVSLRVCEMCAYLLLSSKSLTISLLAAYGGPYAVAGLLKIVQDCLAFLQPQLLRWLLAYISDYQRARPDGLAQPGAPSPFEGFTIAVIMFIASIAQTVILHQVSRLLTGSTAA